MVKTSFIAHLDQLRSMLQWIHRNILPMEFPTSTLRQIELASEEALVNIIKHAYQEKPEAIEIEVKAYPKSHVEISFKDTGHPFNPLQFKVPDTNTSLESREVGGLGIHLMRQTMDEIKYNRTPSSNILVFIKKVGK